MRIALIVGVNYYDHYKPLFGCVEDAKSVDTVLSRHGDGATNFDCKLITSEGAGNRVDRGPLRDSIEELFKVPAEVALLYFAGHGHLGRSGGYLLATDSTRGDGGVPLFDILAFANASPASAKVVILDSCHSGIAGSNPMGPQLANLAEGLTVLTASTKDQYAMERNGRGVFTTLFVDALNGSAANLTGDITPGSIYAHIDQSLGAWEQRPVFKANVKRFTSLRTVHPPIEAEALRLIPTLFPSPGYEFPLDPSFEPELKGRDPEMPPPIPKNTRAFSLLQSYNRLNLLVPIGAKHMWNAAMESKSCQLTTLGEHYRQLAEKGRI